MRVIRSGRQLTRARFACESGDDAHSTPRIDLLLRRCVPLADPVRHYAANVVVL